MVNVFANLSLPQISSLARRTALVAIGLGVVGLLVTLVLGYPLAGLGVCLGLAMAMVNFRLITRATVKASASEREDKRRPLVTNTLGRLGAISVVALLLAWLVRPLGFGTIVGLALFQFTLLLNVTVALLRDPEMRNVAGGES